MEKHILRWSYWLGIVSVVVAVVWRVVVALVGRLDVRGLDYMTAYKAGLLLLLVAIATACYAMVKGPKT
jgi:hypothetical protein